ncbi:MAG: hypothetical protein WAU02_04290 [Candidatus Saccharimonadales bacterium]
MTKKHPPTGGSHIKIDISSLRQPRTGIEPARPSGHQILAKKHPQAADALSSEKSQYGGRGGT